MKLSKLSQRLLAPIAASFTLLSGPAFAKSDLLDKGYAMGVHAAAHCYADKGYISNYQVNTRTKDVLNKTGYGHMYAWLNTSNGEKAVSIVKGYLNSQCRLDQKNGEKAIYKAFKYL